jgi:antitoxin component YwqK of YwqJK toxin-antitoxin module
MASMREGEYVDGKKHGRWVSYFADGTKQSEGVYDMGEKDGAWILYWPSGGVKSEAMFAKGKYTGLYVCYHDNGVKQWEGYYNPIRGNSADGTKEGVWLAYDRETGEVNRVFTYRRGSRAKPDEYPPFRAIPKIGPPSSSG